MESSTQGEVVGRETQKPGPSVDSDMEEAEDAARAGIALWGPGNLGLSTIT